MHNSSFVSGTAIARLLEEGGKACAQAAETVGACIVHKMNGYPHASRFHKSLRTTTATILALYTNCIQVITRHFQIITSVKSDLSAVSTGLTITTTTNITNRERRV